MSTRASFLSAAQTRSSLLPGGGGGGEDREAAAGGIPPLRPVHPGAAAVSGAPLLINNGQPQNSLGYGGNSIPATLSITQ